MRQLLSVFRCRGRILGFVLFLTCFLSMGALPSSVLVVHASSNGSSRAQLPTENNGVGLTPALGWSRWSFIRHNPTAANIEAQADAMKNSGLAGVGFQGFSVQ